jgi:hypothetical protein
MILFLTLFMELVREAAIFQRFYLIGLNLISLVSVLILLKTKWYRIFGLSVSKTGAWIITYVFLVLLIVSMFANLWGSLRFTLYATRALSSTIFYGTLISLIYLILNGISSVLLFSKWAGSLYIIRNSKTIIQHKFSGLTRFSGITFLYSGTCWIHSGYRLMSIIFSLVFLIIH